jgi:transposase
MHMLLADTQASTDILDHLGLVATTIDKLGIINKIDELIPLRSVAKTSIGQRVAAMILNGLGFVDDRLYMFPEFLKNKPVKRLLGNNVKAEHFNNDALGRALDIIYKYGATKLFSELAFPIGMAQGLLGRSMHIDTTTLSVYGEYEINELATNSHNGLEKVSIPKQGYAKNKRLDLKPMVLTLATSDSSGFPVWMKSHSGNSSDTKTLQETAQRMQDFCKELKYAPSCLYVGDSAMYLNCVKKGSNLLWLSRVPETLKLAKEFINAKAKWVKIDDNYQVYQKLQTYEGVEQRWLLVFSKHAYTKEVATLEKSIIKEHEEKAKALWHLSNEIFSCKKDALKKLAELQKSLDIIKLLK